MLQHLLDSHRDMPGHAGHPLVFEKSVQDDPHAAWVEARDAMQALLDDPERAGMEYDGMFGRTSVEQTVDRFLGLDLLIHGWDIARATGQDEKLPEEEVVHVSRVRREPRRDPPEERGLRAARPGPRRRLRAGQAAGEPGPPSLMGGIADDLHR